MQARHGAAVECGVVSLPWLWQAGQRRLGLLALRQHVQGWRGQGGRDTGCCRRDVPILQRGALNNGQLHVAAWPRAAAALQLRGCHGNEQAAVLAATASTSAGTLAHAAPSIRRLGPSCISTTSTRRLVLTTQSLHGGGMCDKPSGHLRQFGRVVGGWVGGQPFPSMGIQKLQAAWVFTCSICPYKSPSPETIALCCDAGFFHPLSTQLVAPACITNMQYAECTQRVHVQSHPVLCI